MRLDAYAAAAEAQRAIAQVLQLSNVTDTRLVITPAAPREAWACLLAYLDELAAGGEQ